MSEHNATVGDVEGRDVLETAARELERIERKSGLDRVIAIGEIILSRFFGGNVQGWRDGRRNKDTSIRRLARHPACPFGRSALNQAVAITALVKSSPELADYNHIGATHLAAVLHVPTTEQLALLRTAEMERLSVRQLKDKVSEQRSCTTASKPTAAAMKVATSELQRFESALDRLARVAPLLCAREWRRVYDRLLSASARIERLAQEGAAVQEGDAA